MIVGQIMGYDYPIVAPVLAGALNTVLVAAVALIIGLAVGILFGIVSCNKYKSWCSWPIQLYVLVIRGTPFVCSCY